MFSKYLLQWEAGFLLFGSPGDLTPALTLALPPLSYEIMKTAVEKVAAVPLAKRKVLKASDDKVRLSREEPSLAIAAVSSSLLPFQAEATLTAFFYGFISPVPPGFGIRRRILTLWVPTPGSLSWLRRRRDHCRYWHCRRQ